MCVIQGLDINTLTHGHTLCTEAAFLGFDSVVSFCLKRNDTKMNSGVKSLTERQVILLSPVSLKKMEKLLGADVGPGPNLKVIC